MHTLKTIDKKLVITHQSQPDLLITKTKPKTLKELRGIAKIKIHGDINDPILPEYEKW